MGESRVGIEMTLSPSQSRVLACLKAKGFRPLPGRAILQKGSIFLATAIATFGCQWEWSWTINQTALTADYRRRIWELNKYKKHAIIAFRAPYDQVLEDGYGMIRHGYILIAEPAKESEAA